MHGLLDNRDGSIDPSRGLYLKLSYLMFFKGFLEGASDWQQFSYDARTYVRLSPDARHKPEQIGVSQTPAKVQVRPVAHSFRPGQGSPCCAIG